MKTQQIIIKVISLLLIIPIFSSAAVSPGIKPGNIFYFLDIGFENMVLFFTSNSENKAKKALEYADERLAEIEASTKDKNSDAIKTATIDYESKIALATEKSKEIKDKGQEENLLNLIADNTSRNQEVLSAVLIKVPEEAKQAIAQAIESSRKSQEEATQQIAELKSEIEQLKKEVAELKNQQTIEQIPSKNIDAQNQSTKIEELKKEVEELKKRTSEKESEKPVVTPAIPAVPPPQQTPTPTPQPGPGLIPTPIPTPTPISLPLPVSKPEVTKFEANKYEAKLGDEITISWDSKNTITCAISESKDISIPFTGRLPNGNITFTLEETANHKIPTFNYYAICADKDWNTAVKEFVINVPYELVVTSSSSLNLVPVGTKVSFNVKIKNRTGDIISMETPDVSQNLTRAWNSFFYTPKTPGIHNIKFSVASLGISKIIQVSTKQEPVFSIETLVSELPAHAEAWPQSENPNAYIPIVRLYIENPDESMKFNGISYQIVSLDFTKDVNIASIYPYRNGIYPGNATTEADRDKLILNQGEKNLVTIMMPPTPAIKSGKFILLIDKVFLTGIISQDYRNVSGLNLQTQQIEIP